MVMKNSKSKDYGTVYSACQGCIHDCLMQNIYSVIGLCFTSQVLNVMNFIFKGACSNTQPHPPTVFKHMEILVPEDFGKGTFNIIYSHDKRSPTIIQ